MAGSHADTMLAELAALTATLDAAAAELAGLQAAAQDAENRARVALGEHLVPGLDAPALNAVAQGLGNPALGHAACQAALAAERARLQAVVDEVGGGTSAQRTAELQRVEADVAEIEEYRTSMRSAVDRRLMDAEFVRLLHDARGDSWFLFSFYRKLAWAEGVLKRHGGPLGIKTLAGLLEKHATQLQTLRDLESDRSNLVRQRALLRSRIQRLDEAQAQHARLEPDQLGRLRHLAAALAVQMDERAGLRRLPPGAHAAFLACRGHAAKVRCLHGIAQAVVERLRGDAMALQGRLQRVAHGGMDQVVYARTDRVSLMANQAQHALALGRRVGAFAGFERFRPQWPLWWDWFVDGQDNGAFLDEVAVFRAQNRGHSFAEFCARAAAPPAAVLQQDPFHRPHAQALVGAPGDHAQPKDDPA